MQNRGLPGEKHGKGGPKAAFNTARAVLPNRDRCPEVLPSDQLTYIEAVPGAFLSKGNRRPASNKRTEDRSLLIGGNCWPVRGYLNMNTIRHLSEQNVDVASIRGVFHGIVQQGVRNHAAGAGVCLDLAKGLPKKCDTNAPNVATRLVDLGVFRN